MPLQPHQEKHSYSSPAHQHYAVIDHLKEEEEEERIEFLLSSRRGRVARTATDGGTPACITSPNSDADGESVYEDGRADVSSSDNEMSDRQEGGNNLMSVCADDGEAEVVRSRRGGTRSGGLAAYAAASPTRRYRLRAQQRNDAGTMASLKSRWPLSLLFESKSKGSRRRSSRRERVPSSAKNSCCGFRRTDIIELIASSQSWIAAGVLGVICAFCAAFVEVVTHWLLGLRLGYCSGQLWGSALVCCADTDVLMPRSILMQIQPGKYGFSTFADTTTEGGREIASASNMSTSSPAISAFQSDHASTIVATSILRGLGRNISIDYSLEDRSENFGYAECGAFRTWNYALGDSSGVVGFAAYVVISVLLALLAALLCKTFAPKASGSGIVEIKAILSGVVIPEFFDANVFAVKVVSICAAVASGLTLGKEGPFVHVGCCAAMFTSRLFPALRNSETRRRELLSCGVAVGVAVAFGAPIGGVLFAIEEFSFQFPHRTVMQAFLTTTVATLFLKQLDPLDTGRIVQFAITYSHPWHWFEIIPFALIGVLGGVAGSYLIRGIQTVASVRRRFAQSVLTETSTFGETVAHYLFAARNAHYLEVAVVACSTACLCFPNILTRYSMLDVLSALLVDCSSASLTENDHTPVAAAICRGETAAAAASLNPGASGFIVGYEEVLVMAKVIYALSIRAMLLTVTIGTKIPSGVFVPSLFIGAAGGRVVGMLMQLLTSLVVASASNLATVSASLSDPTAAPTNSLSVIGWIQNSLLQECIVASGTGQESLLSNPSSTITKCIYPGVYAMVGAVAVLAGVTRMTLSLVVIMFELTGGIEYTVPCMLGVILAKWAGDSIMGVPSLYDVQMRLSSYPYIDPKEDFRGRIPNGAFEKLKRTLAVERIAAPSPRETMSRNRENSGDSRDPYYLVAQHLSAVDTHVESLRAKGQRELLTVGDLVSFLQLQRICRNGRGVELDVIENCCSLQKVKEILERSPHSRYPVVRNASEEAKSPAAELLLSTVLGPAPTITGDISRESSGEPTVRSGCGKQVRKTVLIGSVGGDELRRAIRLAELRKVPDTVQILFCKSRDVALPTSLGFATVGESGANTFESSVGGAFLDWSTHLDRCSTVVAESLSINRLVQSFKALGLGHVMVTEGPYLLDLVSRSDLLGFVKSLEGV